MKDFLKLIVPLAVMTGLALVAANALNVPVVYQSWSTKKCVRVDSEHHQYSCQHLPTKYDRVWVK